MKMQAKQLEKQAKKAEQEMNQLKKKVTFVRVIMYFYVKEISRGNQEGARIYCDVRGSCILYHL